MKMLKMFLMSSLLLPAFFCLQAAELVTVAVFDFDSKGEPDKETGAKVAALINATLSVEPDVVLVERAELEKLLGEQELGLSGTVSPDTAAKVGNLTGAKILVTGRVFKVDKETFVVAKVIGTETSRVYGAVAKGTSSISDLSTELAGKIKTTVSEKQDTMLAKVVSRDERIARLLKQVGEGKRPTISVKIPEQHYGSPVIDPAAETELSMLLQKMGFVVLDEKAAEKPQLLLTGEAFSAYGLRKGNLVSCKARVEIKIVESGTGKVILSERQTSVALDIAEQTAAKTALQDAALYIAERALPKLVAVK